MNILFIGDVFGKPGRKAVQALLPDLRKEHEIDLVIANGENAAHGKGITNSTMQELLDAGVDVVTSGNHWAHQPEAIEMAENDKLPFLRPLNYPPGTPGRGYMFTQVRTQKIMVINLMGRVFMPKVGSDPFRGLDSVLEATAAEKPDVIIVDFHAEASAEQVSFGYHADGKVTAVIGTHTHVPTDDASVLEKGTGHVTDVGMAGPQHSVIGVEPEAAIKAQTTLMPTKLEVKDTNDVCLNYAVIHTTQSAAGELSKCGSLLRKTKLATIDE